MIIEADTTEVVTNISDDEVEVIHMQVSDNAEDQAFIMATLTSLYGDENTAVIRETSSNAIDSHVASGQTRPVEITLPDRYTNQFVVEDFGLGMSKDEIRSVYSKYGRSTKRKSNSQIGAFGYGAKSPLTISDQFTVRAVKDGRLTSALIQKSEDGRSKIFIVADKETDLPNGVKVSVPVAANMIEDFNTKARQFFKFSDTSMFLVDGEKPDSIFDSASLVSDPNDSDFAAYIDTSRNWGTSYVVMGGVPYAFSQEEMRSSMKRIGVAGTSEFYGLPKIFTVPIGAVDLTPNREGLRFTSRTMDVVDKLIGSFHSGMFDTAQADIDSVEDRSEVHARLAVWRSRFDSSVEFTWKGEEIRHRISLRNPLGEIQYNPGVNNDYASRYTIDLPSLRTGTFLVVGRGNDKYKVAGRYINEYIALHDLGYSSRTFLFAESVDEQLDTPWITENSKITQIQFDDFIEEVRADRKAKKAAERAANPKPPKERERVLYPVFDTASGSYTMQEPKTVPAGAYLVEQDELLERSDLHGLRSNSTLKLIADVLPDVKHVVYVSKTRKTSVLESRAKKAFPRLKDALQTLVDEHTALYNDQDVFRYEYAVDSFHFETEAALAAHPDLLEADIITAFRFDEAIKAKFARKELLEKVHRALSFKGSALKNRSYGEKPDGFEWDRNGFRNNYPLIAGQRIDSELLLHAVRYVNAMYTARLAESGDN